MATAQRSQAALPTDDADRRTAFAALQAALAATGFGDISDAMASHRIAGELHDAHERFNAFMRFSPMVVSIKDARGRYLFVNDQFEEALHLRREDVIGRSDAWWLPRDVFERVRAQDHYVVEENVALRTELTVPQPDGSVRHWLAFKFPIQERSGGRLLGAVGVDITAQKVLEANLRRQAETIELQQRIAVAANAATNPQDAFRECLDLMCAHMGWEVGHVLITDVGDLAQGSVQHIWNAHSHDAFAPFIAASEAIQGAQAGGLPGLVMQERACVWVESLPAHPRFLRQDAARASGLRSGVAFPVVVGQDVAAVLELFSTAQHARSEELVNLGQYAATQLGRVIERARTARAMAQLAHSERLASVGTLAAGVAHEINNPLAFVTHNIEYALRELGSPANIAAVREALDEARAGTSRVRQIVSDLRTFSRAEDQHRETVDVHAVLESAINMSANEIRQRARLVRAFDEVSPVMANAARLGQVFLNLLMNAAQAIPPGRPGRNEITVSTSRDVAGNTIVKVRDTGVGMTPEVRARIFEPFFTTKKQGEGTGLGLPIVHGTIKALGGVITVESEPGKGTTFQVALPPSPDTVTVEKPRAIAPATPPARARLLIIDDERLVLQAMKRILAADFDIVACLGGREALDVLQKDQAFDVVLSDLMMPDVSGVDVHRALTATEARLHEKMIFLTGGAFTAAATEFIDSVKCPVLHKPLDASELIAALAGFLKRDTARAA